ncbi:hypothetical protein evm_004633 [Chilo suppressalis]|nr:hypothetical protein evm_004633 [Chilo suppressalis]
MVPSRVMYKATATVKDRLKHCRYNLEFKMAAGLARWWREMLRKRPVLTNTVVYGLFYTGAELSQQTFNKIYTPDKPDVDFAAAARIVTAGCAVYPASLYFWYRFLDKKFVGTAVKTVATKVAADQFIATPILLAGFYTLMGVLERKEDVFEELRAKYWKTFAANQAFWIPSQTVNFYFIPSHLRVVYVASASFIWINVLCFIKRQKTENTIADSYSVCANKDIIMMGNVELVVNCSVPGTVLLKNVSDEHFVMKTNTPTKVNQSLEIFTIALVTIFINTVLHYSFCKRLALTTYAKRLFSKKTILRGVALFLLILTLPITSLILGLALCYKMLCTLLIWKKDKYYVGLLDSFDVFWSLEHDATINVLGVIESDSAELLVHNIKDKLESVISKAGVDKIFYRRNEEYGFYYWRRYSIIDVNQYVELLDFPDKFELTEIDLEDIMSEVSCQSLPYEDEGLFKIFVTKQRVCNRGENRCAYGIIFIIHHSVGDGVALIEFLCKTLADNEERNPVNMFSVPEPKKHDTPSAIYEMIKNLCEMPLCFVDTILRTSDDNGLHGPTLFGDKLFKWTESDENLLLMVKDIKENVANATFSDVLVTALSGGMHDFYTKTMGHVPDDLGVVIPIRFPKPSCINDGHQLLKNDFSVTILELPVKEKRTFNEIKRRCDELRVSADPLSNHYFIKLVSVFPKQFLQPILNSSQATMVFSNIPGPSKLNICGGNALQKLVFFVPHKGNTGLDVTALCYGGVLRFAASVDKALISNPDHLSYILDVQRLWR